MLSSVFATLKRNWKMNSTSIELKSFHLWNNTTKYSPIAWNTLLETHLRVDFLLKSFCSVWRMKFSLTLIIDVSTRQQTKSILTVYNKVVNTIASCCLYPFEMCSVVILRISLVFHNETIKVLKYLQIRNKMCWFCILLLVFHSLIWNTATLS